MKSPGRWSPLVLLALASAACVDLADGMDAAVDGAASSIACDLQTSSESFDPTDGEGTLHAPPFSPSSPQLVARGAHVTVTVVLDGARPEITAAGDGGVEVIDAAPTYCGSEGVDHEASTTHWVVAMHVADRGNVVLQQGGTPVTRWRPEVREIGSLTLQLDDPAACTVDATCLVRAELRDAEGAPLYAEEDFAWSIDGAADTGPFGSWLQIKPTAVGTVRVVADVLGHQATLEVDVADPAIDG